MTDATDDLERKLKQQIEEIRRDYQRAVQPILDQLARLHAMRPMVQIIDGQTFFPIDPVKPCDMGVGCDETGHCFAVANGQPDRCGRL